MDDKNQENNLISSEENDTTQEKDLISSEDVLAVVSGDSVALIEQLERAKEVAAEQLKNSQNTSQSELAKKKLEEELKKREAELAEAKRRRAEAKRKEQLAHEEEERKKLAIEAENKRRIEERQKKDAEEKARIEREKQEQEQKRLAKENEKKAKEAARQAEIQKREEAKKAKIEAREAARKAKEEAKKAMLQQQEIDKKAKIEAKEAARKAKEEAKKARLQQQEADKKAKIEAREAARKAKEEARKAKIQKREEARKAKIQKREEAKKAKIAAKEAAKNKKKEPKANKVLETPVAKAPVVPVQPKPAVQQVQPAPQVTNPAPVSKPVASNSQVTSQQTVSAAPKVAQNLQAQNTEAGKAAKAATNVKAPKKESNFKYYMTAFLFIALILMVIFLPDISSFVSNYFAEKRAQEVPALTTGTLTCTLNTSDDRYDYYYQADFNFRDSQLYRLTYNTTIKGDQNLDAVELAEMEASCNLLKSQTEDLDGITVSCSLSNGVVENEQVLSYENIDVELLTTAYLEAGGTYPNYRYQQNIDEIEKDMNASNYTCERHS